MFQNFRKLLSLFLSFCLILEQSVFAQAIDLSHYFANSGKAILQGDKFRPLHLRYISYDNQANDFKIILDKGDFFNQKTEKPKNEKTLELEKTTQELMKYFFIGLALPNEKFWVNLRPDSPDNILDPLLEKTDIGRIFLEADLQLKKDTSGMTSPQTKEGKEYWDKLYKKAGELFGSQNITIPAITRPWIVPGEIIIGESPEGAYIYKATLKVMLEEDYLIGRGGSRTAPTYQQYAFSDPRLKELNEYSTQLIKETIIPKLTYAVNTSKRYAPLRQVYYSLILAQWFKEKYSSLGSASAPGIRAPVNSYIDLIDSGDLANLASEEPYDKQTYFKQYQKSFADGEYNLQEPIHTPIGQSIRRYIGGGLRLSSSPTTVINTPNLINKPYLTSSSPMTDNLIKAYLKEKWVKDYPAKLQEILRGMRESELFPINSDGTITIKIVPRNDLSENILRFRICQQGQAKHFAYKYNQAEKILYLRNLKTDEDIGIGLTEKISGDNYWLYIDRPHPEKDSFILSDNVYAFNGTELTNRITGAIYPMSGGIIDLPKIIEDSEGIKNLLRLSTSSAMEKQDKDTTKNMAEKLYQTMLRLHEEIITASPEDRNTILEGWSFKIKDAISEAAGLSPEEKESLGKVIHDATLFAHKKEITENTVSRLAEIVKTAWGNIQDNRSFGEAEKTAIQEIFGKVYALTSSSSAAAQTDRNPDIQNLREFAHNLLKLEEWKIFYEKAAKGIPKEINGSEYYFKIALPAHLTYLAKYINGVVIITSGLTGRKFVLKRLSNPREAEIQKLLFKNNLSVPKVLPLNDAIDKQYLLLDFFEGKEVSIQLYNIRDYSDKLKYLFDLFNKNGVLEAFIKNINAMNNAGILHNDLEDFRNMLSVKNRIVFLDFGLAKENVKKPDNARPLINYLEVLIQKVKKDLRNNKKEIEVAQIRGYIEFANTMISRLSSSPAFNSPASEKGGIDFSRPEIITRPISDLQSLSGGPWAINPDLDFEGEWRGIQMVFNAGIRPSARRMAEFAASASASPLNSRRLEDLRGLVTDLLRRDEEDEKPAPADPALKELLAIL